MLCMCDNNKKVCCQVQINLKMPFSMFPPSTIRKSKFVKKRLQTQKRRAYDKYKLVQEQAEGARFKAKSEAIRDSSGSRIDLSDEYRGSFFFESSREDDDEDDEDQPSSTSKSEVQFEKKKHLLSRFCNKLLGKTGKWNLKSWQFLIITFSLHLPLAYVVRHVIVVNTWGATLVLFVYVVTEVIIAIPLYMAYMFLGNYGRKAYIGVWNCVPFFRGMAYSIAATAMTYELLNVAFTGLSLLYLRDVITGTEPAWISCKFPNSHPDCVPMHADHKPYTVECCDEDDPNCGDRIMKQCLKYGTFDYYVSYVLKEGYEGAPKNDLLWKWVVAVIIDWILIYLLLNLGLRRYRYFLTVLNIIMLLCVFIPGLTVTSILSPDYSLTSHAKGNPSSLLDYNFWIQVGVHTLQKETPGDVITLSSLSKPMVNTIMYTIAIYSVKILLILTFTVWSSMSVFSVQRHYKVEESFCIRSRGDYLIFAVIPDVISRWPVHQLMLPLYFLNLFLWGLSTTSYALSSFLEAFLEEFPGLLKWRFLVTTSLCAALGTANVFLLTPNFMNVFRMAQLFISMVALFTYSLDRFKNDYHFKCGVVLENYLIHGFKIAFLLLSVLFFLVYVLKVKDINRKDAYFIVGLLSPILIGMMVTTLRYSLKLRPTLLNPDPKWGPLSRQRRLARIRFDAAEDLHFRATAQICKHNCLIPSAALKKEIKHWQTKQTLRTKHLMFDQESIGKNRSD